MRKIAFQILILILLLCMITVGVTAATASASLTGSTTVRAGDTITLTFKLSGTDIYAVSGAISYDSSMLTLTDTSQKISSPWMVEWNGNNFVAYDNNLSSPINSSTAIFALTFKVNGNLSTGTAISVSCTGVTASDGASEVSVGTVSYSATIAAPLSTDCTLKSLTVSNASISPSFSSGTTYYTASVPYEVSKLDVSAQANDSKATVKVNSPTLTVNGTTNVTVTVTAENGSTKTYTIAVSRAQDPNYVPSDNYFLSTLSVDGFLLSPAFTSECSKYVIWLPYETESVTVKATAMDKNATVQISGGTNLIAGADNEIQVTCTAEDGSWKIYTITAKRAAPHDGSAETQPEQTEPVETEPVETEPVESQPVESHPDTTAPSAQQTEPATQPAEDDSDQKSGGISWWIVVVAAVACFAIGIGVGHSYWPMEDDKQQ